MASNAPVVQVIRDMPTGTLFAPLLLRAGGSTPIEGVTYWSFDAATIWYLDFLCLLRGYSGGGLTFTLPWMAASATTGVTRWGIAIRRLQDDAEDVDTSQTYDYNDADDTTADVSGELSYATITFTDGADMDSWANGEYAIVRVRRNASHANDTMAGNSQLLDISAIET